MDVREKLIDILLQKPNKCTFEQLADFLIAHGVTVQQWISVKDRLPEESGEYVVLTDVANQDVLMYSKKYELFNACDNFKEDFALKNSIKVTHWMPLLKMPKGE